MKKINDSRIFKKGDKVVYVPEYLLIGDKDKIIRKENLGVVTSQNDSYIFVRYVKKNNSQATRPNDLYFLKNRSDLIKMIEEEK